MFKELKQEVEEVKKALKKAETAFYTEETRQEILKDSKLEAFHELCQRKDFQVHCTKLNIDTREVVYLDACGHFSEVSCGGISFRSQSINVTADKRNSSFLYFVQYRVGNEKWNTFYKDSERDSFEIGGIDECQKIWGIEVDPLIFLKFVLQTLCQLEYVNEDFLEEIFEEEG